MELYIGLFHFVRVLACYSGNLGLLGSRDLPPQPPKCQYYTHDPLFLGAINKYQNLKSRIKKTVEGRQAYVSPVWDNHLGTHACSGSKCPVFAPPQSEFSLYLHFHLKYCLLHSQSCHRLTYVYPGTCNTLRSGLQTNLAKAQNSPFISTLRTTTQLLGVC